MMRARRNDSGQIFKGIKKIKTVGRISDFPKAIATINTKLGSFFNFVPSNLENIENIIRIPRSDFFKELVWHCNIISSHKRIIKDYICFKELYSEYLLKGDFKNALEILDKIEAKCGWSLWLIEAKFFCLQQLDGLEGNKGFLEEIYVSRSLSDEFDLVYYLSFLISERNEDGCNIVEFYYRINKVLNDIDDDEFSDYLGSIVSYVVFNDINKDVSPSDLIWNFATLPSIDMYELILRLLVEFKNELDISEVRLPIRILLEVSEKRINRIANSYGVSKGEYWDELNCFDGTNLVYPQMYNKLIMFDYMLDIQGEYINKYHNSIRSIVEQNDGFNDAFTFLTQFSVNFKHVDEIYSMLYITRVFLDVSEVRLVKDLASVYGKVISDSDILEQLKVMLRDNELPSKIDYINLLEEKQSRMESNFPVKKIECADFSKYVLSHSLVINFHALLHAEMYSEAFRLFVDSYISNTNVSRIFKLSNFIQGRKWKFYKNLDSYVDATIVLDAYSNFIHDEKQLFNLKACWRSFMAEVNVINPSELTLEHFNGNESKYLYFLERICIPEVIGSAANVYNSEREIKLERIAICNTLLEHELNIDIIEERDGLERSIAILDGLNEVEIAGLTVDQERFKIVAKTKHRNDFNRYKSFVELMLNRKQARNGDEDKGVGEHILITKPMDEGDTILVKLIHDLGDMFLKNQEFGLDYYLSMRIRHGRLIGVSRGPLERRKLVTKYSEQHEKYLDNEYWYDKYKDHFDTDSLIELNKLLLNFSDKFDKLIKSFKDNQIQVRSDDKPHGMFSIKITQGGLDILKETIKPQTSMDDFLMTIIEYFLILVERSSKEVKFFIESNLKKNINYELYHLQSSIDTLVKKNNLYINPMSSEIASVRTELSKTLDDISAWFDISSENKTSIRTYSMEDVLEISLARTKRIYQEFFPNVVSDIKITDLKFHSSALALLVDVFNIVFSNIYVHGRNNEPVIDVLFNNTHSIDSRVIKINVIVKNEINERYVDYEKLNKIRNEIASNQLKSRQEGGSGFHKLAAMPIISESSDIDFGYDEGEFFVNLTLSLELL
ncbi:hypothetical protein [Vibrio sp. SCSIO 43137]|uniref:hypothetical protein n=1 Tax=Vibrio sp. SCSIO 43137 TaxID=3021011 RepID=UPI0023079CEE|nr:hypothetical protein [Vibrio sp. SCSIO 43137]WCE30812.1 hypothetical protein PK654_05955 [Vibrio sp. SCSIO 43137]